MVFTPLRRRLSGKKTRSIVVDNTVDFDGTVPLLAESTSSLSTSNTLAMIASKTDKSMKKRVPEQRSPTGLLKLAGKTAMSEIKEGMRLFGEHTEAASQNVSTVHVRSTLENIGAVWIPVFERSISVFERSVSVFEKATFLLILLLLVVLDYEVTAFKGVIVAALLPVLYKMWM